MGGVVCTCINGETGLFVDPFHMFYRGWQSLVFWDLMAVTREGTQIEGINSKNTLEIFRILSRYILCGYH